MCREFLHARKADHGKDMKDAHDGEAAVGHLAGYPTISPSTASPDAPGRPAAVKVSDSAPFG